jgi:O-methyltransferase involved in polyketide biosynthesis
MTTKTDTSSISFTAHYTGYVWQHYGLSFPGFATRRGRVFFQALRPFEALARVIVGTDIRTTLLQRHALIDRQLTALISAHPDLQILEIACGLSPRGLRFSQQYPHITYVEADLPGMVQHKHRLLAQKAKPDARHRLCVCNILTRDNTDSLETVIAREFMTEKPLVVITEGLVNYFDLNTISSVWQRLGLSLKSFPLGVYLSDIYPEVSHHRAARLITAANRLLRHASRSRFSLHFRDDAAIASHFKQLGFSAVTVMNPDHDSTLVQARGGAVVRVFMASA